MIRFAICIFLALGSAVWADDARLSSLETGDAARGWEAVGRLDIDGKGFCTGALISERLVLTAAHCMFDRDNNQKVNPDRVEFHVGLRNGRALAHRNVRRTVVHPQYVHTGRAEPSQVAYDLALLELDQPVRSPSIRPFRTAPGIRIGATVGVVSYAHDRADAPSLQRTCSMLDSMTGVYVMSCDVDFGSSGSPVFLTSNGVVQIVSVVSATANIAGRDVSLGVNLQGTLDLLRSELSAGRGFSGTAPTSVRVLRAGEQNETGARFITPGE